MAEIKWPVLQVALDDMILSRSLEMAKEAVEGGVDWIEAGTPLIKSEGMEALRALRRCFPNTVLVADMKTMDTGGYEIEIAAKAGADVTCVLAAADDETIADAVRSSLNYGCKVMADLIGCPHPAKRAEEVEKLGVSFVCVHVGIDQQMRGHSPLDTLRSVADVVDIPIAAAGGINSSNVTDVIASGASIVIVGGAMTRAQNITCAAMEIKNAMQTGVPGRGYLKRYGTDEVREAFLRVSTCNVSDAMHRMGAMRGITPAYSGVPKMIGRAVTVETVDGDWAKPVEAIDSAGQGDVLVISARPGYRAVWGELATNSCLVRGVEGVVVDGAVRDVESIANLGLPVFSSRVCPNAGDPKGMGNMDAMVECGGQRVRPGDWIIGDSSGVVVVPAERALEVANRAIDVMEKEARIRSEISGGKTLSRVLELLKWEKIG